MVTEWGRIPTRKVRRGSLERRLRRGRMRGGRGVAGGRGPRRPVGPWGRQVLGLPPPEGLSFLVRVKRPVFWNIIPNMPLQLVGIIFHYWDLFDHWEQLFLFFFPESICKKNKQEMKNYLKERIIIIFFFKVDNCLILYCLWLIVTVTRPSKHSGLVNQISAGNC